MLTFRTIEEGKATLRLIDNMTEVCPLSYSDRIID